MQLADGVDGPAEARRARAVTVELRAVSAVVVPGQRKELRPIAAEEGTPGAGKVLLDQLEIEHIVARRHRRVGGEDGRAPHLVEGGVEREALVHELADALQHHEPGMAFVQMPDRGLAAEAEIHGYVDRHEKSQIARDADQRNDEDQANRTVELPQSRPRPIPTSRKATAHIEFSMALPRNWSSPPHTMRSTPQ